MIKIKQYNEHACVPACLESIKKDLGEHFDHKQFVQDNLHLFCGGEKIEGSCDIQNIPHVAKLAGLKCQIPANLNFDLSKQFVILFTWWNGEEKNKHCVRLSAFLSNGDVQVMNPASGELDPIPQSWIKGLFTIVK